MVMRMTTINYQNGDYKVSLNLEDGTKTREGEGKTAFPESIDLKITDYCDAGCSYCHESSTKRGISAPTTSIMENLKGLPPGVELAIGGGNPLSHPRLTRLLEGFKAEGWISNVTVNRKHLSKLTAYVLGRLQENNLVYGIGESIDSIVTPDYGFIRSPKNLVWHVIIGIHNPTDILNLTNRPQRLLVLGYKRYGFGKTRDEEKIGLSTFKWKYFIRAIIQSGIKVSFDNLALEQLDLKNRITPAEWNSHYMGDDGKFSMYIDAVKQEFAKSSISPRIPIDGRNIFEMFSHLKKNLELNII